MTERTDRLIRLGFIAAGLANILGILVVSRWMTSDTLRTADPAVFGDFGLLMIMLWGLAYIGTAPMAGRAVLLPAAFALEKLAYTLNWAFWIRDEGASLAVIGQADALGALFLRGYGLNDGLFALFFAAVAIRNWRRA